MKRIIQAVTFNSKRIRSVAVRSVIAAAVICSAATLVSSAVGDTELERMARELAKLRSEIDLVEADLQAERTRSLSELRSLEGRRAALDQQLDAEKVRETSAEKKHTSLEEKLTERRKQDEVLSPVLQQNLKRLRQAVEEGLPFRRAERLQELAELESKLRSGRLDPETGTSRLWHFIEDELKLSGEVVRTKVPLQVSDGGERRLVDAVRLGMVTLYVREDTGYSQLRRSEGGSWEVTAITDPKLQLQIDVLFENLAKQVIESSYILPLPSPRRTEVAAQ